MVNGPMSIQMAHSTNCMQLVLERGVQDPTNSVVRSESKMPLALVLSDGVMDSERRQGESSVHPLPCEF